MNQQAKGKIENSLTVLLVSDLEQSKSYYQNALGCEVTEWWAVRDDFASDVRPNKDTWNTYAYAKTHDILDALYEEFRANGAFIVNEPQISEHDWGLWKEFSIKDPDGYVIGFGSGLIK
ncbi:VOC family protein [Paenibacillus rhizophilus]|uniref:VOC family protein n=1 Tax=Paenibacillus rhizophilus TaxID=1850366 RepID=A0A3N9P2C3_9BACL|nr:VOC family protein [Paenibacillus rhizophilus]